MKDLASLSDEQIKQVMGSHKFNCGYAFHRDCKEFRDCGLELKKRGHYISWLL